MKRKIFLIIILFSLLTAGLFTWQSRTYSKPDAALQLCEENKLYPSACDKAYCRTMAILENAWTTNLASITEQEKPASSMVDDAFESFRTYQCWLDYICEIVTYSGTSLPEQAPKNGLTHDQITQLPGCQKIEDVGLPAGWEAFVAGVERLMNKQNIFSQRNKFLPIPECYVPTDTANPVAMIVSNYDSCRAEVDRRFGCGNSEESLKDCAKKSSAMLILETALKRAHADQKARVLEQKLASIITKMLLMENHAAYMTEKFFTLDTLHPCYAKHCD